MYIKNRRKHEIQLPDFASIKTFYSTKYYIFDLSTKVLELLPFHVLQSYIETFLFMPSQVLIGGSCKTNKQFSHQAVSEIL